MNRPESENTPPTVKRFRPLALAQLAAANVAVLLILYVLAECIGERHWLICLFAYCPPLIWTLVTILLSAAALIRRNGAALGWCGIAWLCLLVVLGIHIPLNRPAREPNDLSVLTFNILAGAMGVPAIAETIRHSGAEVVVLQEADNSTNPGGPDPLPALKAALPEYTIVREGEVALVTRLPLRETRAIPVPDERKLLFGVVEWHGKPITVAAVHLSVPTTNMFGPGTRSALQRSAVQREKQTDILLAECARITGPLIVAGDFNTPPRGPLFHRLIGNRRDSFADCGFGTGWSYSAEHPMLRIDYILTTPDIRASRCFVLGDRTSDHRPVLAYLRIPMP